MCVPQCHGAALQFVQCNYLHTRQCVCKIWEWCVHVGYFFSALDATVSTRTTVDLFFSKQGDEWNYLHGVCVGQASNPGPWMLQLRNVVSASKHIDDFTMNADCHVWSETSATSTTLNKVLKKTRKLKASLVSSAPAPSRSRKGDVGGRPAATGTLSMSRARAASLADQWEGPVYSSGRVSDALLQLASTQVRVISVYGYHSGIHESVAKNDILLGKVMHRAQSFQLPVIIAGDLNCDINLLESWQAAVARGFVDVAARQAALQGSEPEHTYKGQSRLDYVLCNDVAARAFQNLTLDPQGFTDHAALTASFDWELQSCKTPKWLFPRALDGQSDILGRLSQLSVPPGARRDFSEAVSCGDTSRALSVFTSIFEGKIDTAYREVRHHPAPPAVLGRTKGKIVMSRADPVVPSPFEQNACDTCKLQSLTRAYKWILELQTLQTKNKDRPKQVQLWDRAIRCDGFQPTFPDWLLLSDVVDYVPLEVPKAEWLAKVVSAIQLECTMLQQRETKIKNANIARCMKLDWSKGGRLHSASVKPVPLGTLDSLVVAQDRPFSLLRSHKGMPAQIRLHDSSPTPPDAKLTFKHGTKKLNASITKVDGQKIQLDAAAQEILSKAQVVTQEAWTTDTSFIASSVQSFWKTFWQTDRRPDMSMVGQMIHNMPQVPTFDATVTADEVSNTLSRLTVGKARGMDGFSVSELRACGPEECQMLAELFNSITSTGTWPQALLPSFVALLAKVPHPKSPKDARPITVLTTLYRIWGKLMGVKIMQAILPFLSPDLFGSVPGRSANDAAWELQSSLEEAFATQSEVVGVSLDLSKAYNTIPREVVAALADRCGWPPCLKHAYLSFLNGFHRFFKIHGGFHCPTFSDTGVPEGCPIAVPVMIMVTSLVTNWSTLQRPEARLISYVDNWTLTERNVEGLTLALDRVWCATEALALLLNPDKTRAFSTSAKARADLRNYSFAGHPLKVCHAHDDLGVWFTSTLRSTSAALSQRTLMNKPKLKKLQMMPWSATRKAEVLVRTICPSLLHGISWASTSNTCINNLRGRFSATVWGQHHHRDHFLCPLLSLERTFEPFLMIFRLRLMDLRRASARHHSTVVEQWNSCLKGNKSTGAFRYFFEMCQSVDVQPLPDLCLLCPGGKQLHIATRPIKWLMQEITQIWMSYVGNKLCSKHGMDGIQNVDLHFASMVRKKTKIDTYILGAFTTNAAVATRKKVKFLSAEASLCKHCGLEDDATHRMLYCPFYEYARKDFPTEEAASWHPLLLERGLMEKPTAVGQWESLNDNRTWPLIHECLDDGVHLFTDGSTDNGDSLPSSAWSVVLLEPNSFNWALVYSGLLPGKQSNYRAEIFAAWAAVKSAPGGHLYIDNLSVVRGLRRLITSGWDPFFWNKQCEQDMWWELWIVLREKGPQNWQVDHVRSHRDFKQQSSDFHAWTAFGNDAADRTAKQANAARPQCEAQLYQTALCDWNFQVDRMEKIANLQHRVFKAEGDAKPTVPVQVTDHEPLPGLLVLHAAMPQLSNLPDDDLSDALLGPRYIWMVKKWWCKQSWHKCEPGISIAELYVAFCEATGWSAPQNVALWNKESMPFEWPSSVKTAFVTEIDYAALSFNEVTFAKQCTIFLHSLKFLSKRYSLDVPFSRGPVLGFLDVFEPVPCLGCAPDCWALLRDHFKSCVGVN